MWEQIESNKRKTFFTLLFMSLFVMLFGLCGGILISDNIYDLIILNIIFYAIFIGMFIYSYKHPLSSFGDNIYEYNGEGDKTLYNIVSEMKIASGMSQMPKIYILDSNILNAFACGTNEKNARIVVSKGLLKALNRDELQGVIGHEIAHIVNRDTCYLLYASIIVNLIANFSNFYLRSMRGSRRSSKSSQADVILLVAAVIFAILAPILANMFYFFLSRKREYLADACSAKFTRYPMGLASALKKISSTVENNTQSVKELKSISSPLAQASFIVPLKLTSAGDSLFSTHPSTKNRINILLKMGDSSRADFDSYNRAYEAVTRKSNIIQFKNISHEAISLREGYKEPTDISNVKGNINSQMIGAVALSADCNETADKVKEEIKNHRKVEDMMWDLAKYINIDCSCGTKLKIPESFKGQTIFCPHCKKQHIIQ